MPGIKRWLGMLGAVGVFTGIFFATRLPHLTTLPIFTDEAIYIRWSQIGMRDANWRFISLTDGKQPMFTWVMMILLRLIPRDPLFVGRLTSVISGFATLWGVWLLSMELFRNRRIAWTAAFFYLVIPFTLWYDRMALYDSMVSAFSVWSLYIAVLLVRRLRLDLALLLGMVLGAGMLNKSSGFLSLYLLPVTLLLFDWQRDKRWMRLIRFFGLLAVAAVSSQIYYSVLRLSPFFHMVAQKDNVFLFSLSEWFDAPFRFLAGNLRGMFDWLRTYLTLPIFVVAFIPLFTRWSHWKERLLLYAWWLLPFVALANFAKILYPRFVLFMTLPLLLVAAEATVTLWQALRRPLLRIALLIVLLAPSVYASYYIVTDPIHAPIAASDRGQYIDDWPAGGGVPQVVSYLATQVQHEKISVFTEGTFGLLPYAIEIYLVDNPNITIKGIWPLPKTLPEEIKIAASIMPTYFILNETQTAPINWPLTLIGEYQKGTNPGKKLRFYRVGTQLASSYDL